MPYNGTGTFNRVYSWTTDAANGILVSSSRTDTDTNDIATGLSNCVTRDGQSAWTANLPAGGYKITGLANGAAGQDSVTWTQVFTSPTFSNPTFTGTPITPTAAVGTNTTQVASTAFVQTAAFTAALPVQTGNAGAVVSTDGSNASWATALTIPELWMN